MASAQPAVYHVGPERANRTLSSLPRLQPGDVVEIDPGVYPEARKWTDDGAEGKPITLRGTGITRPVIDGTGLDVTGAGAIPRALFQIEGDHYRIENLEFRNAHNGQNGAGLRITGASDTVIRHCRITHCEMGVMSNDNDRLLIDRSEIAYNGNPEHFNGYAHNLYLEGNRTTVRFCWIHDAIAGMNFKSRGHYTELLYNWIADSNEGELSLVDSEKTAAPGSNTVMIGNVIVSKADRTGNTGKFIDWGQDMGGEHNGTLYLFHNTLVAGSPKVAFLSSNVPGAKIEAANNLFYGSDRIMNESRGEVAGMHNGVPSNAVLPDGFKASLRVKEPGFADLNRRDFRLISTSPCRDAGQSGLLYSDEGGAAHSGSPRYEMAPPFHITNRHDVGSPDLGALGIISRPVKPSRPSKPAARQ